MSYPIVIAHGVCRFDKVLNDVLSIDNSNDPQLDQLHYFKGLRTELMHHGYAVYHSRVSWAAGVDTRAGELKDNILEILAKEPAENVISDWYKFQKAVEEHKLTALVKFCPFFERAGFAVYG